MIFDKALCIWTGDLTDSYRMNTIYDCVWFIWVLQLSGLFGIYMRRASSHPDIHAPHATANTTVTPPYPALIWPTSTVPFWELNTFNEIITRILFLSLLYLHFLVLCSDPIYPIWVRVLWDWRVQHIFFFFFFFWGGGYRVALNPGLGGVCHYISWTDSNKTESVCCFQTLMLYFQRISFQII